MSYFCIGVLLHVTNVCIDVYKMSLWNLKACFFLFINFVYDNSYIYKRMNEK